MPIAFKYCYVRPIKLITVWQKIYFGRKVEEKKLQHLFVLMIYLLLVKIIGILYRLTFRREVSVEQKDALPYQLLFSVRREIFSAEFPFAGVIVKST